MGYTVDDIKELRDMTSCGVIECKKALEESNGDIKKAKDILKQRGIEIAAKKGSREAREGRVEAYIHQGAQIGVIVEVNCETDFVAQNDDFKKFTKDLAIQIAASNPKYISKDEIPEETLQSQEDQKNFICENCLLEQVFVKDPNQTIQDLINSLISSIGENISISRFIRYKVNEVE